MNWARRGRRRTRRGSVKPALTTSATALVFSTGLVAASLVGSGNEIGVAAQMRLLSNTISHRTPSHNAPQPGAVPVTLRDVAWLGYRRLALTVQSAAMAGPIQVQVLLARDWFAKPNERFPVMYMLDGLRANDLESGWTHDTSAERFFADKNINVVLPIGGQSSFYADWLQPDNGKNYKWETFLIKELPAILEGQLRSTNIRGVQGLSMGGTSAMFLTGRNLGFFKHAASYSGFLTTTSLGMPQAIITAMRDSGGFSAIKMWGPPSHPQWAAHDPYLLAERLRGTSLYVSSGSGSAGPHDLVIAQPAISGNVAGVGLEVLSRLTSQNFATKLTRLGIPAQVVYRPAGTHSWPYWDQEMRQSWPQAANSLGVGVTKPACKVAGAIAKARPSWLGDCITGEYPVRGGVAQDFLGGQMFYSAGSKAHPMGGRNGGAYQANSGPAGRLGLPTSGEIRTPDRRGVFQRLQNGIIYFTPQTSAHAVGGEILREWGRLGHERSPLGYPIGEEVKTPVKDGSVQAFQFGAMYFSPKTGARDIRGLIMKKYAQLGFENSWLGFATSGERPAAKGGRFNEFEGGNIYFHPGTGAFAIRKGPIFDAWRSVGFESGRLGFPISEEISADGGIVQRFQGGSILVKNGRAVIR